MPCARSGRIHPTYSPMHEVCCVVGVPGMARLSPPVFIGERSPGQSNRTWQVLRVHTRELLTRTGCAHPHLRTRGVEHTVLTELPAPRPLDHPAAEAAV